MYTEFIYAYIYMYVHMYGFIYLHPGVCAKWTIGAVWFCEGM